MEKNEGVNFGKNLTYTRERFAHAAIYRIRTFAWNKSGGENLPNSWKLIREQRREIRKDFHFFSSINAFLEAVSIRLEELFIRKKKPSSVRGGLGAIWKTNKKQLSNFSDVGKMMMNGRRCRKNEREFSWIFRHDATSNMSTINTELQVDLVN